MDYIALPVRGSNVAPIFDFSPWLVLFKLETNGKKTSTKLHLQNLTPMEKAKVLLCAGVKTVICGCISDTFQQKLERSGIKVIWGITGPIMTVLEAFKSGQLDNSPYRVLKQKVKRFQTNDFFPPAG